jgi:positive regulator of sigma E activity
MITGVVLPLLMVIKVLESTFFLNFFSYAASLIGMVLGIIGTVSYSRRSRQKRNQ